MASITLRSVKGSALTNAEVDANFTNLNTELASKQDTLVSGTSIKTVNGQSVLGSGNIQIDGGVVSFNTRTGAVTLSSGDVTTALGFTPVNKAGDTITGVVSLQGDHGSSTSLVVYNTTSTDGRSVVEFRNDRNAVQRYLLGVDPDGGSNKAFALRDVTGGAVRLWVTSSGNVNVGASQVNNSAVNINKTATGSATLHGFGTEQVVQSDVSTYRAYNSSIGTQATAFTLGSLIHFRAAQGTLGAGSSITSQNAFVADASLTGAGTNIGFRGVIPSGTNRWNLFMDGTASNHLAGPLGINTTFLNDYLLRVGGNMSGGVTRGAVEVNSTAQSDVTSEARGIVSAVSTAATAFTVGQASAFFASQGTVGAGSTITTQVGFLVSSGFTGGGTNNYGFRGAIPSGSGRWNLFMDGTAANFLAGGVILNNNLGVGASGSPSYGTSGQVLTSQGAGAAPTWTTVSGGGGTVGQILETAATITSNFTIQAGNNGFSVGPVTIQSGVSVTVPAGRSWLVAQTTTPSGISSGRAVAMAIVFGA